MAGVVGGKDLEIKRSDADHVQLRLPDTRIRMAIVVFDVLTITP